MSARNASNQFATMNKLTFSYNWNNKLDCKAFTTIRLSDRFKIGDQYNIFLKEEDRGLHEVVDVRKFLLKDISEFVARIDTGYSKQETIDVLQKMYKNKSVNWNTQQLSLVLLKKV